MEKQNKATIRNIDSKKSKIDIEKANKFCKSINLSNEAEVESYFIDRLLKDLSYPDADIKLKRSIDEFNIGLGSKKVKYKPDYIILVNEKPALVIDAKNPKENINEWKSQCSSYCIELNRLQKENPVKYFMLTNGFNTILSPWDHNIELFQLNFIDFVDGNKDYEKFKKFLVKTQFIEIIKKKRQADDLNIKTFTDKNSKDTKSKKNGISILDSNLINDCIKIWDTHSPLENDPTMFLVREEVYKIFKEKIIYQDDIPLVINLINSIGNFIFTKTGDLNSDFLNIFYLLTTAKESLKLIQENYYNLLKNEFEKGNRKIELLQLLYILGHFGGLIDTIKISIDELNIQFFRFLINEFHILDTKEINKKHLKENRTEIISDLISKRNLLETIDNKSEDIKEFINKINDLIRNILKL